MQRPGRDAIALSKAQGLWWVNLDVDALVTPPDLLSALTARMPAHPNFMAFAPSHRRNVLRWIAAAKQPATRAARIEKTVALAVEGKKLPQL